MSDQGTPTRDFSGNPTGFTENGLPLVKIDAKAGMFHWDGKANNAVSFFLDRVDMAWQEARPQNMLPARWEVDLVVTIGDSPETAKQFRVPLSSHWNNSVMGSVINAVRGGLDSEKWKSQPANRWVRVVLKMREGKNGGLPTVGAMLFKSQAQGDWLESYFPWEKDAKSPTGVPENLDEQRLFWLSIAKQCVDITGGSVIGADKATIRFHGLAGAMPQQQPGAVRAAHSQPAGTSPSDKYKAALAAKIQQIADDPIDTPEEKGQKLGQLFDTLLEKVPPTIHGLTDEWLKGELITVATTKGWPNPFLDPLPGAQSDDLPF